jgi:hypothetical protein
MSVDERAEHHAEQRQQQHVGTADDARREHGPRLEVHPERQREPQEAGRDVRDGGVDEHTEERAHAAGGVRESPCGAAGIAASIEVMRRE